jgi:pyruvate, water dikinase
MEKLLKALTERAKELDALYHIENILNDQEIEISDAFIKIVKCLPNGFQAPEFCTARIIYNIEEFKEDDFSESEWCMSAFIKVQDERVGSIDVYYKKNIGDFDEGPFLKEERKLINTIAERLGFFILHQKLKIYYSDLQNQVPGNPKENKKEWRIILDMLRRTDKHLYSIISRKMINYLFTAGVGEAKDLFIKIGTVGNDDATLTEVNRPSKKQVMEQSYNLGNSVFDVAEVNLSNDELLFLIQKWINEEKSNFLVKALVNQNTPLAEVADAIRRFTQSISQDYVEDSSVFKGIIAALIRRFLTDQVEYIQIAKNYCSVSDFNDILQNMIIPNESHGKLGGKSAGLFLAKKIIDSAEDAPDYVKNLKIPKTWYITSDGIFNFMYYNNLEDIIEHKYREMDDIRKEYHHIVMAFKNSQFSPEITNGLSRALDDFGENPIIIRSSSLLEDRLGSAFAGKYKSLFLANQGTKQQRLEDLMDAIAEVYASTFGPDPIGYRIERGLLDFNEEMGIMIQEVVGTKVGKYFLPSFAGVAFSNNEFRWSPRIKREDGLIRIVPGLGTRAVDRIGDDFPILIAPGQPNLRVNLSAQDSMQYSPKNVDLINLETNTFETVSIDSLMKECGNEFPMLNEIFSINEENHLKKPIGLGIDTKKHEIVVTFENMFTNTNYIKQINAILNILKEKLKTPVDIEFACNGRDLFLLQCRPQSLSNDIVSANIPGNIPDERILFTANKYISNGRIPDINYIVYVDPELYGLCEKIETLKAFGRAVGKLNQILPKKKFILMGPGRWGSRGDIRLGVNVCYSDINNTSMLVEIAKKKGSYTPDLSFGTHFFQDLVESGIRYLPLYPDEDGNVFHEEYFKNTENLLSKLLPEYEYLSDTLKVINISSSSNGNILRILTNADEGKALAFLADPQAKVDYSSGTNIHNEIQNDEPWRWRHRIAESISEKCDYEKLGVLGFYLVGTVYNQISKPEADIDIIIYVKDKDSGQSEFLLEWLNGWDKALIEWYHSQYGYKLAKLLDVKIIDDKILEMRPDLKDLINSKHKI